TVSKCSTFGTSVNGLVEDEKQLLSVYPNPANDVVELNFDFKPGFQYNVGIYDLSGRLILRESVFLNSQKIDVSGLDVGFYTVQITAKNGLVEAAKLAVVR
ncbi:MAG TPA: T9SS type A sorting domain-containing protein, partial [Chitinophagales bacterium]|nr:T9SS type A sorting domain-containing protein [Chitinophagales bacterium]